LWDHKDRWRALCKTFREPLEAEAATLRAENETLRASVAGLDAEATNATCLMIDAVWEAKQKEEELTTLRAERGAAIARAEEAERGRSVPSTELTDALACVEQFLIEAEFDEAVAAVHSAANRVGQLEATVSDRNAKLAQAEGEIATMRERAAEVCDEAAAYFDRTNGHYDRSQAARSYRHSASKIRRLSSLRPALTTPEPPHGD
jgi:chromosome segregation ATPase